MICSVSCECKEGGMGLGERGGREGGGREEKDERGGKERGGGGEERERRGGESGVVSI